MVRLTRVLGVIAAVTLGGVAAAPPAFAGPSAGAGLARPAAVISPARGSVQPWPITITIRTVPSLPGIRFVFDGTPDRHRSPGQRVRHGAAQLQRAHPDAGGHQAQRLGPAVHVRPLGRSARS